MATRVRVTRLANPRKRRAAAPRRRRVAASRTRKRNAKGHFISARKHRKRTVAKANPVRRRRRNAAPKVVTRYKTRTRTVVRYRNRYVKAKANPVRRRKNRAHSKRNASRRRNPALLVTLGAVNPRRKNMAHRRRRRSRKNPTTVTVRRNRRHTVRASARRTHRRRRNSSVRRRNPVLFGSNMSATTVAKTTLSVLVGVTIAKLVPPMLPAALTSSPAMRVIVTGVTAFVAGMAGNKMGAEIGSGILLGGLAQTASQALNAFVPSIGSQIGLSGGRGMGMLVPGGFPIPQNPVNAAALAPVTAMVPAKGVNGWQGRGLAA